MYRILLILLTALLPIAAGHAYGQKSPAEVRRMLEQRDAQIKSILGENNRPSNAQRETLKNVINGVIDFESMSREALGKHWAPLSAQQKEHFVQVFSDIVRSQSLSNLDVYRSTVSYEDIRVAGDSAHVVTSTIYKDIPTRVEYRMIFRNSGWHVSDIILDDVSTTEGYARSFQSVIRKKGFDALMTSLEKRRDREARG